MVDAWPGSLPQHVQVQGYSEASADNLLRAQMDVGPAKVRRRSTAAPRPVSCEMELNRTQLATLRTFVETTLIGGSLPFNFPGISDSSTWLVRFADKGLPKWSGFGGNWFQVQFTLEVLP